ELFLIAAMARNLRRHRLEELAKGFTWEMWQSIQLQNLQRFRRESRKIVQESGEAAREAARELLTRKGGRFAKVEALIEAVTNDLEKAEYTAFRLANDVYRQTIFRAQI